MLYPFIEHCNYFLSYPVEKDHFKKRVMSVLENLLNMCKEQLNSDKKTLYTTALYLMNYQDFVWVLNTSGRKELGNFIWKYDKEYISEETLSNLTPLELKILRNTFYAKHGRVFYDVSMNECFKKFDWYKSALSFKESDLNDIEKENIGRITEYEKKLKDIQNKNSK